MYAGTDGGVFKTTNGGTSWQPTGVTFGNGVAPATTILMTSGHNQAGHTNQPLRYPFVAVVTNANGVPVVGVAVDFTVVAGGGTLSVTQGTTDSQGVAFTMLTMGPSPGTNTVTATAAGLNGSPVIFDASGSTMRRGQLVSQ